MSGSSDSLSVEHHYVRHNSHYDHTRRQVDSHGMTEVHLKRDFYAIAFLSMTTKV